ncbi:hypothetical protein ASE04_27515 [Rhizobium sp. Root708]|uniref:hypothetical protein n=1 Tax=Rhizobium sp. Root708 TaxID=1736592 RepID=UPI0006F83A63|nr:hypothetical protein [Rhizobium sp. Root708]KRB58465.1 hypothetical protein ASE04_27515 [Rhizobium sp. Root708]
MPNTTPKKTARIEVFRTGTFTPMEGQQLSFSAADLKAMADAYDFATAPAPVVVGHPKTDAPAFGWAQSFDYDAKADRLFANVGEIAPAFADAVKAGTYKKVSLSFHRPDAAANPVPGTWYPKHIGFLGGAAPAVTGLQNVQFSQPDDAGTCTVEFGERGLEETASILRALREFFIEKFGMEDADKALPGFRIEWLAETELQTPAVQPSFSASPIIEPKEPPVTKPVDPAFAAREAEFTTRFADLQKREQALANAANVSFAETLVTDGKLLPASKDKVVAILNALPADTAVSFADGANTVTASVSQAVRDVLSAQPKIVSFGATDLPEAGKQASASFASDGHAVDRERMEVHDKALAYQRAHPGTEYIAAVKAVQ